MGTGLATGVGAGHVEKARDRKHRNTKLSVRGQGGLENCAGGNVGAGTATTGGAGCIQVRGPAAGQTWWRLGAHRLRSCRVPPLQDHPEAIEISRLRLKSA